MIHRTEEIMQMPGYCRDDYERQITRLERKLKLANEAVNTKDINKVKCALCHIDICIQGRVPTAECFVTEHKSPEMPDANISAELGSGNRSRRNSDGSLDNSSVEKDGGQK